MCAFFARAGEAPGGLSPAQRRAPTTSRSVGRAKPTPRESSLDTFCTAAIITTNRRASGRGPAKVGRRPYSRVPITDIGVAFLTDPWGTTIGLSEGINELSTCTLTKQIVRAA